MGLGQRIEERRKAVGISQAELARRVGVRQSTMNSLINGDSRSSRSIVAIARELRTTPAYLVGDTNDPDREGPDAEELTSDETRMLSSWRQLSDEDKRALQRIIDSMNGPKTVHSPRLPYRLNEAK